MRTFHSPARSRAVLFASLLMSVALAAAGCAKKTDAAAGGGGTPSSALSAAQVKVAFVPGGLPLTEAVPLAGAVSNVEQWREALGGRAYDEAVADYQIKTAQLLTPVITTCGPRVQSCTMS